MKTKEVNSNVKKASEAMLTELINKFGFNFMCDFEDVKQGNPLYVALCDNSGEIKTSPFFPRLEIAETFVSLCKKHIPGCKDMKFRIYKF